MRKFSTGKKAKNDSTEAKIEASSDEVLYIKILNLMDTFLSVKSLGSVDNRFLNGKAFIDGKEDLIHALMDILKEEKIKESKSVLEKLKLTNKDWFSIDNYINNILSDSDSEIIKENLEDLSRRYDEDVFIMMMEHKISNMNSNMKGEYLHALKSSDFVSPEVKKNIINKLNS